MSSEPVRLSLHTQSSQLLTLTAAPPDFIGHPSLCPAPMPAAGVTAQGRVSSALALKLPLRGKGMRPIHVDGDEGANQACWLYVGAGGQGF